MGLDPSDLPDLGHTHPAMDSSSLSQQGQHHGRCGDRGRACVPWDLLSLDA